MIVEWYEVITMGKVVVTIFGFEEALSISGEVEVAVVDVAVGWRRYILVQFLWAPDFWRYIN